MRLLCISGSLRKASHNSIALKTIGQLAGERINVSMADIGQLPLFNPDIEGEANPAFEQLRTAVSAADGLIIASPEYAHGISGVMKNALDWLVSGEEFIDIPIMLINTSPRASIAQEALREVLRTMSGNIIEEASVTIPLLGTSIDVDELLADNALSSLLSDGLNTFAKAILEITDPIIE